MLSSSTSGLSQEPRSDRTKEVELKNLRIGVEACTAPVTQHGVIRSVDDNNYDVNKYLSMFRGWVNISSIWGPFYDDVNSNTS